ncbi:Gfo/Idh/MocA family protein [Georgenia subflava]|uniref:Gfo/Idh/MocA family oxidoreductase n=1 Tax=Georgenia subflava TaxID=1622177 RepID=A0A6N7EN54_9MICO|nr:Gfo/Idh/MocA family oxidoreductase [Georgenia subflava]MPV37965.1 hypothetical protein [Georgenia subflava]
MSRGLGVLVVGAGHYGSVHADALARAAGVRLAGVVDDDARRAHRLAGHHDVPAWTDLDVAIEQSGADVAAVVVPTVHHADVAAHALRGGLHVVVEKPVCLDMADVHRLDAEALRQGKVIDVISQRRFQAGIYAAKQAVDAGVLGRVTSAQCDTSVWRDATYFTESPWRGDPARGGGNLFNHGMHALDLLLWFLGDAQEVAGWRSASRVPGVAVEELLVATLRFDEVLATLHASLVSFPGNRMRLTVTGERGTLDLDGGDATLVHLDAVTGEVVRRSWPSADPDTALRAQYEDLVHVVAGVRSPRVGLAAGARTVLTASALLTSAARGGSPVEVETPALGGRPTVVTGAAATSAPL